MRFLPVACVLVAALTLLRADDLVKVCELDGASLQLTEADVLEGRYPSASGFHVSEQCMKQMQALVGRWLAADEGAWERLSNQACSYKLGWVEHHPGTCQAGGPPPICPANHWYRDPNRSKAQQEAERARVRGERAAELNQLACGCAASEVRQAAEEQPPGAIPRPKTVAPNPFGIPCSGSCPLPGYNCVEGFCQVASAIVQAATSQPGDTSKRYLMPDDLKSVVERAGKALAAISQPVLPGGPVFSAANTTALSPWLNGYRDKSLEMQGHLQSLSGSLEALRVAAELGRDIQSAERDAAALQTTLRSDLTTLQQYAAGMERDQTVAPQACPEVFAAQNSALAESVATVLGLEVSAAAWPSARGGWPLEYAYILADFTCGQAPAVEKVRFLSQVFGFCGPDMKADRVIDDTALFLAQVVKVSCAAPARELSKYVVRENTPDRAEQSRARDAREPGRRVVPWTASADYPVRSCR